MLEPLIIEPLMMPHDLWQSGQTGAWLAQHRARSLHNAGARVRVSTGSG